MVIIINIIKKSLLIVLFIIVLFCNKAFIKAESITAESYCLLEASSKRIIEGKNIHQRFLTASICKVLTGIIIIENMNIDEYVLVDRDTIYQEGSSVYLKENDMITIRDLLYGLLLRSGNDCAYLLAKSYCYNVNDFSKVMNKYAQIIGMQNSTFSNPSGLDNSSYNYSTAYDMALLMIYAMKNETFREIVQSTNHFASTSNGEKYYFYNKHKLVQKYDYIIGGKTGYTEKAGRTLITYASKNNMELSCVTFKSNNDWNEHMSLINNCYKTYEMKEVMKKQIIKTKDDYSYTPYLVNDVVLPVSNNERIDIKVYLLNNSDSKEVGKVVFLSNNKIIYEEVLYRYY